jgi:hypothetical protein
MTCTCLVNAPSSNFSHLVQVARLQGALAKEQLALQPVRLHINVPDHPPVVTSIPGLPAAPVEPAPIICNPPWNDLDPRSTDGATASASGVARGTAGSLDIKTRSSNASSSSFGPGCLIRAHPSQHGSKSLAKSSPNPVARGRRRQVPGKHHDLDAGCVGRAHSAADHKGAARELPKDTALETYMHPMSLIPSRSRTRT